MSVLAKISEIENGTQNKAQPYPSESTIVEQEKVQNQIKEISAKLNEIENMKQPIVIFRAGAVKDVGYNNNEERINKSPGIPYTALKYIRDSRTRSVLQPQIF